MNDDDWFAFLLKLIRTILMFVVIATFGLVLGAAYMMWAQARG